MALGKACGARLRSHSGGKHLLAAHSRGRGVLTAAPLPQMYQKEVEILEELNRLTGASLRPLTAGLF